MWCVSTRVKNGVACENAAEKGAFAWRNGNGYLFLSAMITTHCQYTRPQDYVLFVKLECSFVKSRHQGFELIFTKTHRITIVNLFFYIISTIAETQIWHMNLHCFDSSVRILFFYQQMAEAWRIINLLPLLFPLCNLHSPLLHSFPWKRPLCYSSLVHSPFFSLSIRDFSRPIDAVAWDTTPSAAAPLAVWNTTGNNI